MTSDFSFCHLTSRGLGYGLVLPPCFGSHGPHEPKASTHNSRPKTSNLDEPCPSHLRFRVETRRRELGLSRREKSAKTIEHPRRPSNRPTPAPWVHRSSQDVEQLGCFSSSAQVVALDFSEAMLKQAMPGWWEVSHPHEDGKELCTSCQVVSFLRL